MDPINTPMSEVSCPNDENSENQAHQFGAKCFGKNFPKSSQALFNLCMKFDFFFGGGGGGQMTSSRVSLTNFIHKVT